MLAGLVRGQTEGGAGIFFSLVSHVFAVSCLGLGNPGRRLVGCQ